ncbi:MAG TPA: SUMF1/EgtB/PvdO family nonheme iron enzyme [Blastocatellia bacterium]|nr:SUMF1/EgtB/PvdO family nonheme iron enzyme [Blastocatellia bacterium]HMZ17434.1 SUMF1/EgtB/PvdO family nonheme iron enzyme [Blastocatellia bacterium]HNG28782.1 SUMF1/EgtB/PvdO family nonheme iron enzyme [Blastocatellia bacterium]
MSIADAPAIVALNPQLPADVPADLQQTVANALLKDSEQRFKTAVEMREALTPRPQPAKVEPSPPIRRTVAVENPAPVPVLLLPKPEPAIIKNPARQSWLSPAVKWSGARLAAIVIALVSYLATKTPSAVSPNSLNSIGDSAQTAASRWPGRKEYTVDLPKGVKVKMVSLPGGEFKMGGLDAKPGSSLYPVHSVKLSPFAIGMYEVTQAQWEAVMGNNPSFHRYNPSGFPLPVEQVSYGDIIVFLKKAGNGFRLPTEAEWEYAARAGTIRDFSYNDLDSNKYAWYNATLGGAGGTAHVGSKLPNPLGLYDIHGNVAEWCSDLYDPNYYATCHQKGTVTDPRVTDVSPSVGYVVRGGSWNDPLYICSSAWRDHRPGFYRKGDVGFRLVRDVR